MEWMGRQSHQQGIAKWQWQIVGASERHAKNTENTKLDMKKKFFLGGNGH